MKASNILPLMLVLSFLSGCAPRIHKIMGGGNNLEVDIAARRDKHANRSYVLMSTSGEKLATAVEYNGKLSFSMRRLQDSNACMYVAAEPDLPVQVTGLKGKYFFQSQLERRKKLLTERMDVVLAEMRDQRRKEYNARTSAYYAGRHLEASYGYDPVTRICREPAHSVILNPPLISCAPEFSDGYAFMVCGTLFYGEKKCSDLGKMAVEKIDQEQLGFFTSMACGDLFRRIKGEKFNFAEFARDAGITFADMVAAKSLESDDLLANLFGIVLKGVTISYKVNKFGECLDNYSRVCVDSYQRWKSAVDLYRISPQLLVRQCDSLQMLIASSGEEEVAARRKRRSLSQDSLMIEQEYQALLNNTEMDLTSTTCTPPEGFRLKNANWAQPSLVSFGALTYLSLGKRIQGSVEAEEREDIWFSNYQSIPYTLKGSLRILNYPALYALGFYDHSGTVRFASAVYEGRYRRILLEYDYLGAGLGIYIPKMMKSGTFVETGMVFGSEALTYHADSTSTEPRKSNLSTFAYKPFIEIGMVKGQYSKLTLSARYLHGGYRSGIPARIPVPQGLFSVGIGYHLGLF